MDRPSPTQTAETTTWTNDDGKFKTFTKTLRSFLEFQFRNEINSLQAATFELQIPAMRTTSAVPSTQPLPFAALVDELIFVRLSVNSLACLKASGCFRHEFRCRQTKKVRNLTVGVVITERGWKLNRTAMAPGAARTIREIKSAL